MTTSPAGRGLTRMTHQSNGTRVDADDHQSNGTQIDADDHQSNGIGAPDRHPCEVYLPVEGIDHTRTKTRNPQTDGICERFNNTLLDEFYRLAFRERLYTTLDDLQADLDQFRRGVHHSPIPQRAMVL